MKITFPGLALVLLFTGGSSISLKPQINCPQGAGKLVLDNSNPETGKMYTRTLSIGEKLVTCVCIYKNTDPLYKLEKTRVNVSWINNTGQGGIKINRDVCDTNFRANSMGIDPGFTYEIRLPDKAVKAEFYSATQANLESAKTIARQMIAQVEGRAAFCNYGSNSIISAGNSNNPGNSDICRKNFEKLRQLLEKKSGINHQLKILQDNSFNEKAERDKLSRCNKFITMLNDPNFETKMINNPNYPAKVDKELGRFFYDTAYRTEQAISYGLNPGASEIDIVRIMRDVAASRIDYYKDAPIFIQRQKNDLAVTEAAIEKIHRENTQRKCPGDYDITSCDLGGEWIFTRWDTDIDNGTYKETWVFTPISKGKYSAVNQKTWQRGDAETYGHRVKFSITLRPDYTITHTFLLNDVCNAGGGNTTLQGASPRLEVKRSDLVKKSYVQDKLYDISFNGNNYQGMYQREKDKGVPIDVFFFSINHITGYQAEQDGQKLWGRFVRKPATDHTDQSTVQWWFSNWVSQNGRWVKKEEKITTVPKIK